MKKFICVSIFFTFSTVPLIISYFLSKRYRKFTSKLQNADDNSYYQCIFFDYKNFNCRTHFLNKNECGDACSYVHLIRLLKFIESAKHSISMCMYMLTLKQVSTVLVNAARRGVNVRVIMDKAMSQTTPTLASLKDFDKWRVFYKMPDSTDVMLHHKFCLIDENHPQLAKMFFGSLNLTAQAMCKNFETVVLTNNSDWIQTFSQEFEDLWFYL
ncbi:mitochondrial cardiolipin hydrolase-like [Cylas formicarius]|uniref:mitochondrial cardiolipin hydrolase-like n=1 Tax=Cylas formicarius TaxID=197179 RepID=UPI002958A4A6|nr:mitochondrial cardiolipin hydrolase-like [Cylas formicarius]